MEEGRKAGFSTILKLVNILLFMKLSLGDGRY